MITLSNLVNFKLLKMIFTYIYVFATVAIYKMKQGLRSKVE